MKQLSMAWGLAICMIAGCDTTMDQGEGSDQPTPLTTVDEIDDAREPFARACARLHGECSAVCDNVLVECYDTAATCTEQWYADYLEDYRFPLVDPALVAECAAQVDRRRCTDLRPDTAACEYAIVDSCHDDRDDFEAPYSPFWAVDVELERPLSIHLCADVPEYYAVELSAGDTLVLVELVENEGPHLWSDLLRRTEDAAGNTFFEEYHLGEPVPLDGEYIVVLDAWDRSDHEVSFALAEVEDE